MFERRIAVIAAITGLVTGLLVAVEGAGAKPLADPTRPSGYVSAETPKSVVSIARKEMKVDSILISPRRKVVVINGRVFAEGDFLGDIEITEIGQSGIGVSKNGRTFYLTPVIQPETVKRQS